MPTFLAQYGPDSTFGWLLLLLVANLPLVAVSALILAVIFIAARAALGRYRPPEPPPAAVVPDPAATASYLRGRARIRRGRSSDTQ
jgi:hypothetical protein